MCGRYSLEINASFPKRYNLRGKLPLLTSNNNIAPAQNLPVIIAGQLEIIKWGLIPFWSKEGKDMIINARAESVMIKSTFRKLIYSQRCLVPATGFYEWKKTSDRKIPYNIFLKTNQYFSLAGIYDFWKNSQGNIIKTFAIITTAPNDLMQPIHNRMPVILKKEDEELWSSKTEIKSEKLTALFKPYLASDMEAVPTSIN